MVSESKLTPKQHKFAELVAGGDTLTDSYRGAYNATNMKSGSIRTEASKLMANPHITQTVQTLRRRIETAVVSSNLSDRERVLYTLRAVLDATEGGPAVTAQLRAAELLGKSIGLFKEVQITETDTPSLEEIDAEIMQRIEELSGMSDSEVH